MTWRDSRRAYGAAGRGWLVGWIGLAACAPTPAAPFLLPRPMSMVVDDGVWRPVRGMAVIGEGRAAQQAAESLRGLTGYEVPVSDRAPRRGDVELRQAEGDFGAEGYRLTVDRRITIEASTPEGLFRGSTTLVQALPVAGEVALPWLVIDDAPRFGWRGSMIDVARHFFDLSALQRHVDLMAAHKLNRLHLHLTDDQGWRLEIAGWPELIAIGGAIEVGGGEGGFLSSADYAALQAYAAERFVVVVPEIDMPGHVGAALASVPALNPDGQAIEPYTGIAVGWSSLCVPCEATLPFVTSVLSEVATATQGPWLHIGGDEADATDPAEYRSFVRAVHEVVQGAGKTLIGWEEIAEAELSPPFVAQHWRRFPAAERAVEQGGQVIASPADRAYLDMMVDLQSPVGTLWAGLTNLEDAYTWDPQLGLPDGAVLGIEAPLWSETTETWADVEFLVWPRLAGHAELGWSPAGGSWTDYVPRLRHHGARLDALGVPFYRSPEIEW